MAWNTHCDYYEVDDNVSYCLKKGLIMPSACEQCEEYREVEEGDEE